jgi:hypothetical protein
MRGVLQRRASVYEVEKSVLLKAFAKVLKKRSCDVKDTAHIEQFQAVWKELGVCVSNKEAVAIFNKYGQVWHAQ